MIADTNERKSGTGKSIYSVLAVFVLLVLVIAAGRQFMFDRYEKQAKSAAIRDLADTGALRAKQLSAFLRERRGDAAVLASVLGASLPESWWKGARNDLPTSSQRILDSIFSVYGYAEVLILDPAGEVRFSAGRSAGLSDAGKAAVIQAAAKRPAAFSDLYSVKQAASEVLMLDTIAPIMSTEGESSVGMVLLRGNWDYLSSILHSLPSQDSSVEYLLVRRDGSDLLLLNPPGMINRGCPGCACH